ncbi:helix-turn-helix transcriptional regulator [Desulfurispora thermophila]|uniref:helix-turn-helix transcriptional regulator n=1 Tax=Desulfurispora thermophila TaxID=265470 RepID=UPI000362BD56|nr:WYL domain-containing protein [Desulfurispora thermophila]
MPERSAMRRLMDILAALESHPAGLSARQLAEITGYPARLILQDLNDCLLDTDLASYYPLYVDEDEEEGPAEGGQVQSLDTRWHLETGGMRQPPLQLSQAEALALAWLMQEYRPGGELERLGQELLAGLGVAEQVAAALAEGVMPHLCGGVQLQGGQVWELARRALLEERKIVVKYFARNWQRVVQWQLWPLGLVFHSGNAGWYLIARLEESSEIVACHLGRVQELRITEQHFDYPEDFSLARYLRLRWGMDMSRPETVRVHFYNEAGVWEKVRREFAWRGIEGLKELPDGLLEYHGPIYGVNNFARWVLSFGSSAVVLEPDWLREKMLQTARYWLKIYGDNVNGPA